MPERCYTYFHPETTCWGLLTNQQCSFCEVLLEGPRIRCLHSEVPDDVDLSIVWDSAAQCAEQPEWCPARKDAIAKECEAA